MALAQTQIINGVVYTQINRVGNVATWQVHDPRMVGSRVYQVTKIVGEQFPAPLPIHNTNASKRKHRLHRANDLADLWRGRAKYESRPIRQNSGAIIKNKS